MRKWRFNWGTPILFCAVNALPKENINFNQKHIRECLGIQKMLTRGTCWDGIDFDGASKAWMKNKTKVPEGQGAMQYVCTAPDANGEETCGRPVQLFEELCAKHKQAIKPRLRSATKRASMHNQHNPSS